MNILQNHSLKSYNTFGLEANAKYFVEVTTVGELQEVVAHLGEFLQAVGADGSRQISNSKEPRALRGLESHTA